MPREAPATSGGNSSPLPLAAAVAQARVEVVRERLMEEILLYAGEVGFRNVSVQGLLDRCGGNTIQFYKQFANKDECFAAAYEAWMERVATSLLAAAASEAEGWREGLRAALVELCRFVSGQPQIARALFLEAQIVGGPVLERREAAMERLAEAVDSVRTVIPAEEAPPEATGMFVVGGVEACVCDALAEGRPELIWDALPELMQMAVAPYFGEEAAQAEFEAARAVVEAERRGHR